MPEIVFTVHWPDGVRSTCVSPSTALQKHLAPGTYDLSVFLQRARAGFAAASDRVREVYGFPCSRAASQMQVIEEKAAAWEAAPDAQVSVEFS
jgi:uncharacterized repeat protein (TIGR04042 family)